MRRPVPHCDDMVTNRDSSRTRYRVLLLLRRLVLVGSAVLLCAALQAAGVFPPLLVDAVVHVVTHPAWPALLPAVLTAGLLVFAVQRLLGRWAARSAPGALQAPAPLGRARAAAVAGEDLPVAEELTRTRAHEAGHAVVAHTLGFHLVGVTTHGRPSMAGRTEFRSRSGRMTNEEHWHLAVVAVSGLAAERELLGEALSYGGSDDYDGATTACAALAAVGYTPAEDVPCEPFALLRYAQAEADRLVAQHRREVEAVASALEGSPELSGEDIVCLLQAVRSRDVDRTPVADQAR